MLNIIESGQKNKTTLVMLHGLGGTHRYWNTGLERLEKRYHIVRIDLLGFGDSPQPWQNYTLKKHLKALEQALENFHSFIIIGHSLGAALGLTYAEKHPQKIKSLILISLPYFKNQQNAYQWMRRTPSGWLMTNMFIAALTCMTTRRLAKRILPRFLTMFPEDVVEDLVKHNVMSSTTTLWNVLYNPAFLDDIQLLEPKIPVFCIHAKNDATAPYKNVVELTEKLPSWKLISLEESDHHPWLWDNKACIDFVLKVMQRYSVHKS